MALSYSSADTLLLNWLYLLCYYRVAIYNIEKSNVTITYITGLLCALHDLFMQKHTFITGYWNLHWGAGGEVVSIFRLCPACNRSPPIYFKDTWRVL